LDMRAGKFPALGCWLALAACGNASAGAWSDLWLTPEQRGQQLLDSKQAGEAAPLFKDPRRKGYAESRAGDYAKAAQALAPLHDTDSLYNRGNALAHTGKLDEALAAYDAALAQSPGNRDIARNRELVQQAIRQQQGGGQGKQGGQNGKSGQSGQPGSSGQSGNSGQNDSSGQKNGSNGQPGSSGQNAGNAQNAGANQPDRQNNSAGQPGNNRQNGGANPAGSADPNSGRSGNSQQKADNAQGSNANAANQPAGDGSHQSNAASAGSSQDEAKAPARAAQQSQRAGGGSQQDPQTNSGPTANTATAAAGSRTAEQGTVPHDSDRVIAAQKGAHGNTNAATPPPRSEQALALDQWLRGIPEDSGELLRRKFLIEHMMKQQGTDQ
jgi:Ca-activated chloride channel homolog